MTRPSDIPPWAWERAVGIVEAIDADWSKGDFETALSEATRELASVEEERRWFEAVERIARALMEERKRAASIAYRTCAETHHVTLGNQCADAIEETKSVVLNNNGNLEDKPGCLSPGEAKENGNV